MTENTGNRVHQCMFDSQALVGLASRQEEIEGDIYYVAYKIIILLCISFMFIEMKFIYCHSCVIFEM